MSSSPLEHALSIFTFTNDEHLDLIGKIPIKKYEAILKILGNNESDITHNYALKETITLMENLAGSSKKDIEKGMKHFVPKAAVHISNLQWQYYGDSTARLELILRAMSSVLHVLSNFVDKLEADTRASLYKSISKFWTIYRNSKCINANIVFSLREIRNCLRLVKDDQSIKPGVQISFETIINIIQEEYVSAFTSFIQILNFEYATGEWYYEWRSIRRKYFKLRKKSSRNNFEERTVSFYKELIRLSDEEFMRVERKNTKYRNLEYRVLKYGGAVINCSLPDHIDTLLLGYLHLIQRLLEEFFPQIKEFDKEIVSFCNKIIQKNIKKQLTFKAIEILYIIYVVKGNVENEYFKRLITYKPSQPPQFKPNNILVVSPSSFQFNNPLESAASDFTSFSTPPQSPPALSIEENQNRQSKISSVRKFTTQFQKVQSFSVTRTIDVDNIINDVIELFYDRRKTRKNICDIETEFKKLLNNNKTVDENLLSKLKKILEKKAPPSPYEPSTPSPNKKSIFPFFSLPKKKVKNKKSKEDEEIVKSYGKGSDNNTISSVNTEDVEKESIEESEKIEENVINSIVREVKESEKIEENVVNSIVGKVKESEKIEENVVNSIVGKAKEGEKIGENVINSIVDKEKENEKAEENVKENGNNGINSIVSIVSKEKENEKVEENAEESEIFEGENVEEGENFEENAEENEKVKESDEENAEESDKVKESEQVEEENEETEKVEESDKAEEENAQGSDNVEEENAGDNESKNNNTTNFVSIEKINEKIKGQNVEKDKNLEESGNNNISIIITEEEEEKEEVKKENVEKINQEKTHLNIINHYTVNHIIQTQQTQPEQPEQPEPEPPISPIFKTIKKVIKEIEIIVDKAAKAHKEAVLKSANNSSTSVNVIFEEKK